MRDSITTTASDDYVRRFDAREYLRQYYSLSRLCADDIVLFRLIHDWNLRNQRRYGTAVDIGCGPTIHNAFAFVPYVDAIDLADYLPGNRAEVQKWIDSTDDAHDWDAQFLEILTTQGAAPAELPQRKAEYRQRFRSLLHCDLRNEHPLGSARTYDLVISYFCAECVAANRKEWQVMMVRLLGLVAPRGSVCLAACREAQRYRVMSQWFPAVPITEDDIADELLRAGFPKQKIETHVIPAPEWSDDGFDHICLVKGLRG